MTSYAGGCQCRAIRYEVTGEPLFTHACHCTLCQQRSGSAFGLSMILESSQFKLSHGSPASAEVIADSGNRKFNHFCNRCGTVLFGDSGSMSGLVILRPGTLDDTKWFKVGAHIWTRSRQSWWPMPDDIPCFDEFYDREKVWPAASLQRLRAAKQ